MAMSKVLHKQIKKIPLKPYSFYILECPDCKKLNPNESIICWNCNHSFLKPESEQGTVVKLWIWLLIILVLLIFWMGIVFWVSSLK